MDSVTVWHPVRDGFKLEVIDNVSLDAVDNPQHDRRMTIVVYRERIHLYPAWNRGRGEWIEVGRLTVSAWDNEALLCFADTTCMLLTFAGKPVALGNDEDSWGACAGQIVSENGELALAVISDDGNEITYRLASAVSDGEVA
jgi:hypothetical protein